MQTTTTILSILILCVSVILGRKLNHHFQNKKSRDEGHRDSYGESLFDQIYREVDHISDTVKDIEDVLHRNDGGGNKKEDNKKALTPLEKRDALLHKRHIAYKNYMKKMENVKTVEDYKRVFNVKDTENSYKRNTIPDAPNTPCSPQTTTEPAYFTGNGFEYIFPTCIPVKRCGGCCGGDGKKECVATAIVKRQVNVQKTDFFTGTTSKHTVEYLDHTACGCACRKGPRDCSATQTFDSFTCTCVCPAGQKQNCPARKQWSSFECKCVCDDPSATCAPGYKWNTETCLCDKLYFPTCDSGRALNSTTCLCN